MAGVVRDKNGKVIEERIPRHKNVRDLGMAQFMRKPAYWLKLERTLRIVRYQTYGSKQGEAKAVEHVYGYFVPNKEYLKYDCEHCGDPTNNLVKFTYKKEGYTIRLCEVCKKLLL